MKRFSTRQLTLAALVAALYVVLGYFGSILNLTFGVIQFRFAEALTVLPFLCPVTAWGLFVGCVVTNLLSPYGPLDLVFGSLATLLAGLLTARCKSRALAPLPPVICNAVIVSAVIAFQEIGLTAALPAVFGYHAVTIGLEEAAACYGLGSLLLTLLPKTPGLAKNFGES